MDNATTAPPSEPLPVPVIVVIAVGGYLLLIVALVVLRQFLVARGICMACAPCGKEDGSLQCCDCWISCAEACDCCAYPNVKSCLDSVCGPPDNRCSMTKCLTCQACQNNTCCGDESTGCESCCGTGDGCSNQGCESCFCGSSPSSCCEDPTQSCCWDPTQCCCGDPTRSCCGGTDSCSCPTCKCAGCDCACQAPECDTIDCLCFKINMHN